MAHVLLSTIRENEPNSLVVLKIEIINSENRDSSQEAIINEVETLLRLNHTGIIKIYPIEENETTIRQFEYRKICSLPGHPWFLVLEHLPGGSLVEMMDAQSDRLSLDRTVAIIQAVANALAHAHDRGFVHMDLKPQHIYFRRPSTISDLGDPVLIDFGIARNKERSIYELQQQQRVSPYISPERLLAQRDQKAYSVNTASDIYALGVILYEMISGQYPFKGGAALTLLEEISKKSKAQPPYFLTPQGDDRERQGVAQLDRLLFDMLSYIPERRPTAQKVANELRDISFRLGGYVTVQDRKSIETAKAGRGCLNRLLRFITGVLLFCLALVIGILIGDRNEIRPWREQILQTSAPYLSDINKRIEPIVGSWEWLSLQLATATPTSTPTATATITPTVTPTVTPTATRTQTVTPSPSSTATPTATNTITPIPTSTFATPPTATGTRTP